MREGGAVRVERLISTSLDVCIRISGWLVNIPWAHVFPPLVCTGHALLVMRDWSCMRHWFQTDTADAETNRRHTRGPVDGHQRTQRPT